jgi:hypothetical protein
MVVFVQVGGGRLRQRYSHKMSFTFRVPVTQELFLDALLSGAEIRSRPNCKSSLSEDLNQIAINVPDPERAIAKIIQLSNVEINLNAASF